ncbi:S-adenosyl-L-methionine-dependent methyltransferase [Cryphonectria parasitica EP155]|uniref:S-adenosyl-L-methionine-dependent methyltransferase n=1 Tax=Cryphonectria parasitica (strain ATCC 38755 / EP155) TaxID=660469 RepID=A0A9P4Y1B1_CRYP1|nr:S-adenosyl-L-methionine-dependent methyltransferase [Cryphonectria parasitica EP155]KAF3764325.1 S-adenosyl-L-methionine-dependent methyltransferase [Cryphonectria parasitica EP155]
MAAPREQATYTFGHHASVINSHARRTAQDSAAFLLPHIQPNHTILDVGCGPGTITTDLAQLVPQGRVTGVDFAESVLDSARAHARGRGVTDNLVFEAVDANALPYADGSFDVVFCHQVLQHVKDPVGILREMRRVARPGGVVAAREADYKSFAWYPEPAGLDRWQAVYRQVARACGGQPDAGRYVLQWAKEAGFQRDHLVHTWSSWHYTGEAAEKFGESWVGRALHSDFAKQFLKFETGSQADLEDISATWGKWSAEEDRFIVIPNGEILYKVPESST